jgi:16S rRNA (cytosine1402-N4)-methyltransferase
MSDAAHLPVMLNEVLDALRPTDGGFYVDGTFGRGGYAGALLDAAHCTVLAIDRDPQAIAAGRALADRHPGRLLLRHGRFGDLQRLVTAEVDSVDGVTLDLGVSSPQLDDPARGFSFRADGPLDMRMDPSDGAPTAADLVNRLPEGELADLIFRLGEERKSRRVAHAIVAARAEARIETTAQLAEIVRRAVGRSADGIDPATRTFQALRLAVNEELEELDRGLVAAERVLKPAGRLAVVAFHSLEDRAVKQFLKLRAGAEAKPSRHAPAARAPAVPSFRLLGNRALRPGAAELAANPRARSARLRAAERTSAAPLSLGLEGNP